MSDLQAFAALHAPVAPYTWEIRARLENDQPETGVIPIHFRRPVEIVGMFPTVILAPPAAGGLLLANTDDIECLIDINQKRRLTNQLQETGVQGPGESFVTLSSLSVFTPRLLREKLRADSPDLGVQFRWKVFNDGAPDYEDIIIGLSLYCRFLDADEVAAYRGASE